MSAQSTPSTPTDATRLRELLALDRPEDVPGARAATLEALRRAITLTWQTAETRIEKPTVLDEVQFLQMLKAADSAGAKSQAELF